MKNCKAVIFDLGGVLLNIDYRLTIAAFNELGVKNADLFYSKKIQNPIFDKIEIGAISPKEFLDALQKGVQKCKCRASRKCLEFHAT
jgi:putative hydrolase of the HAD superfamily